MRRLPADPILVAVARFVRDLLVVDEAEIVPGRSNVLRQDLNADLIVLDTLGPDTALASSQTYDGDSETMAYGERAERSVTIDFYGPSAYERATRFRVLSRGEASRQLQRSLGLTVYHPSRLTDVKALTGEAWQSRIQLEIMVGYSRSESVATLRIDTATLATVLEE